MNGEITYGDEWVWVDGYEGYYQVSHKGEVRSVDRRIANRGVMKRVKGRVLKHRIGEHGYHIVALCKNGTFKNMKVHRLVANAFVGRARGMNEVNHKDGNKDNNSADNLEWCSRKHNIRHSVEIGLRKPPANRRKVRRSDGVVFESITDAARSIGSSSGSVCNMLKGKTKHVRGYSFEYVDE